MNHMQFRAPPLTKINKIILITAGACFLIAAILKAIGAFSLVGLLGLSGSGLMSGLIYQVVTWPLVETQLMGFLFNALLIWFIGSELESQWGSRVYLRFLLLIALGVSLIYIAVGLFLYPPVHFTPLHGLSGLNFSLLIAYALLYPDRHLSLMLIFPMRARTFCWILIGIEAYLALFSNLTTSWAHLVAMGISYLILRFQSRPIMRKVLNSPWPSQKRSSKKRLYVVKDEDQKPPRYWH